MESEGKVLTKSINIRLEVDTIKSGMASFTPRSFKHDVNERLADTDFTMVKKVTPMSNTLQQSRFRAILSA